MDDNGRMRAPRRALVVVGTRPEAIKMSSLLLELGRPDSGVEPVLCSTGQHRELLDGALDTFGLTPDHELGVMRHDQDPADLAWSVARWVNDLCRRLRPDVVVVQGDTTTAMAAGLAGFYSPAVLAHVEAGLRTYDNAAPWPEEAHRRVVGALADLHFAPTEAAGANLRREGVPPARIHVTGNTGVDALHWALAQPRAPAQPGGTREILVTAHRRESIPEGVEAIVRAVQRLAERLPDVRFRLLAHPSPAVEAAVLALGDGSRPVNVEICEPRDYVSFVRMLANAHLVITDSGGVQEEAPAVGTPALVVRELTERGEAVDEGTSLLVGTDEQAIVAEVMRLLDDPSHHARMARPHEPYGDGRAGRRIAAILEAHLSGVDAPATLA